MKFVDREPVAAVSLGLGLFGFSLPLVIPPIRQSMGFCTKQVRFWVGVFSCRAFARLMFWSGNHMKLFFFCWRSCACPASPRNGSCFGLATTTTRKRFLFGYFVAGLFFLARVCLPCISSINARKLRWNGHLAFGISTATPTGSLEPKLFSNFLPLVSQAFLRTYGGRFLRARNLAKPGIGGGSTEIPTELTNTTDFCLLGATAVDCRQSNKRCCPHMSVSAAIFYRPGWCFRRGDLVKFPAYLAKGAAYFVAENLFRCLAAKYVPCQKSNYGHARATENISLMTWWHSVSLRWAEQPATVWCCVNSVGISECPPKISGLATFRAHESRPDLGTHAVFCPFVGVQNEVLPLQEACRSYSTSLFRLFFVR